MKEDLIQYPSTLTDGGLEASVVGLHLRLRDAHFDRKGKMKLTCTASVGRMRIDGRTDVNISVADLPVNGDYPRQRSLTLDSRSGVGNFFSIIFRQRDLASYNMIYNLFFFCIGMSQQMTFWNWRLFCPAILLVATLLCQTFG
jgi:hypothetical protein